MVVTALYVASYLDRFILTLVVPEIKDSLHLSDTQIGLIIGPAFGLSYAIFSLPAGWLSDKFSRKLVIFWGAILFTLATAFTGLVNSFLALLICRVLVGIGEATLVPAALPLLAEKFSKEKLTTAISIFSMGPKIGVAIAYALGGGIIGLSIFIATKLDGGNGGDAWRLVFLLTGLPSLFLGFLCLTFGKLPRETSTLDKADASGAFAFIREQKKLFFPMLMGISAVVICGQGIVAWVPAYLSREFSWEPMIYGPIFGLISLLGAGSLVLKGMVMEKLFVKGIKDIHLRFFTWLLVATYPIAICTFLVSNKILFTGFYAIISVITIPSIVYPSIVIQMVTPANLRGRVFALFSVPVAVLGGLGAPIVGILTDFFFEDPMQLGAALAILMAVFIPIGIVCLWASFSGLRMAIDDLK